jgi:hypothetical protein
MEALQPRMTVCTTLSSLEARVRLRCEPQAFDVYLRYEAIEYGQPYACEFWFSLLADQAA